MHLSFQIIEDFLELMYRCMFLAPLSLVQSCLSPASSLPLESLLAIPVEGHPHTETSESPLLTTQLSNCTSARADSGHIFVESEGTAEGFMQFRPRLTNGKYTWKVKYINIIQEAEIVYLLQ